MAKIAFSKFGLKPNTEIKTIEWDGQNIEVLQYLPIQKKLGLIGRVISMAHEEDANYSNPVKIQVFTELEILFEYTNITFTDKQREDLPKLYDILSSSGLIKSVISTMPAEEYNTIVVGIADSIDSIYKYQHSFLGIVDALQNTASDIEQSAMDAEQMKKTLVELAETPFVKQILPMLDHNA